MTLLVDFPVQRVTIIFDPLSLSADRIGVLGYIRLIFLPAVLRLRDSLVAHGAPRLASLKPRQSAVPVLRRCAACLKPCCNFSCERSKNPFPGAFHVCGLSIASLARRDGSRPYRVVAFVCFPKGCADRRNGFDGSAQEALRLPCG